MEALNLRNHQRLAAIPGLNQEAHQCVDVQIGNPFSAADRVAFEQKAKGQDGFFLGDVHRIKNPLVGLGVSLFAVRAAEPAKSIAMFSKALAIHVARLASYSHCGFCIAHHVNIILLAIVVCQRKSALKMPLSERYFGGPRFHVIGVPLSICQLSGRAHRRVSVDPEKSFAEFAIVADFAGIAELLHSLQTIAVSSRSVRSAIG